MTTIRPLLLPLFCVVVLVSLHLQLLSHALQPARPRQDVVARIPAADRQWDVVADGITRMSNVVQVQAAQIHELKIEVRRLKADLKNLRR